MSDKKQQINKTSVEDDMYASKEFSKPSDLLQAMEILQNPKNLESNTILDNYQVNALTMMNWAGQVYEIEFFKHYCANFPKYRISGDDGRGRREIIQIAESIRKEKESERERFLDTLSRR